jgi:hypothetical protein
VTAGIPVDCPFCGIERPDNGKAAESRRFFCGRRAQFFQFNFVRSFVQFPGFQEVGVRGIVCCKGGPVLCLCQVLIGLKILYRVLSLFD